MGGWDSPVWFLLQKCSWPCNRKVSLSKCHVFCLHLSATALLPCPRMCPRSLLPALSSACRDGVAAGAAIAWSQLALGMQEGLQHGRHLLPTGFPRGKRCCLAPTAGAAGRRSAVSRAAQPVVAHLRKTLVGLYGSIPSEF